MSGTLGEEAQPQLARPCGGLKVIEFYSRLDRQVARVYHLDGSKNLVDRQSEVAGSVC
jgi:hypothetical protein